MQENFLTLNRSANACRNVDDLFLGQDRNLPLFSLFFGKKRQGYDRPNAKEEAQCGPQVFRIIIIPGKETAHKAVETVHNEGSYQERRQG